MIIQSQKELKDRIETYTSRRVYAPVKILEDTTEYMSLSGGDVLRIDNNDYFILGEAYEGRFGINDQPKFWVKQAVDLSDGQRKIIKLVYYEDFIMQMGKLKVRGIRSPEKESHVLSLTTDHPNFMHGKTVYDSKGNYLGKLSNNPYDPDSISNPYGKYGDPFSPDSINNPFGPGDPYSAESPNNPYGDGLLIYGDE